MINNVMKKKRRDQNDFKLIRFFHTTCYLSDHVLLCSKILFHLDNKRVKKYSVSKCINTLLFKSHDQRTLLVDQEVLDYVESSWKSLREATQHLLKCLDCLFANTKIVLMRTMEKYRLLSLECIVPTKLRLGIKTHLGKKLYTSCNAHV